MVAQAEQCQVTSGSHAQCNCPQLISRISWGWTKLKAKILFRAHLPNKFLSRAANQARFFIPEDITFNYPTGMTSDGRNLFVADTFNRTVRKIVIASGIVTTLAGKADLEGALDATGSEARFKEPIGITTDGSHLFVTVPLATPCKK